ncbi:HAD hydrolase family protein [Crossiella sp. CA-258035]|uniref:HAD hydrolase family protein n=1 Tax=Crossiella sp. CA-258035 TaxID=2981138 RepID=UPI0024BCD49D|nr:HAD hydrolase family protein [Crossiella sp. CA-258035]WHT16352.1 HAD hydrolase family protein [Crossiella sp. CA-258035]
MRIRYAALDLDGTLIDEADEPYEGVVAGLRALRKRGVLPLVITGRAARSFRNLRHLDDLFAEVDDEVLLSEGNVRIALGVNELSFSLSCPNEVLRTLAEDSATDLVAECSGEFYASSARAAAQFAMAYRVPRRQIEVTGKGTADIPWFTAVTIFRSRVPVPEMVAGLDCEAVTIGPFGAHVVRPRGTSKAAALRRHLRRRFNEPDLSATMAIGDTATDASMLAACALGIATQHADEAASAAADRKLDGDLAAFLHDFRPEGW